MKIPLCEICEFRRGSKSCIIDDYYYRYICDKCYNDLTSDQTVSSGEAEYNRGRDAEEHEGDMMQPYSGGKISPEFIQLYPETARKMWTDEEIDQATRS